MPEGSWGWLNEVRGERAGREDVHAVTWRDSPSAAGAAQLAVMVKISKCLRWKEWNVTEEVENYMLMELRRIFHGTESRADKILARTLELTQA